MTAPIAIGLGRTAARAATLPESAAILRDVALSIRRFEARREEARSRGMGTGAEDVELYRATTLEHVAQIMDAMTADEAERLLARGRKARAA